jgi:hypothetical protein
MRVQSSLQKLSTAATALNEASDRFAKLIAEIDAVLKNMNIGIASWVIMGSRWCDENGNSGYDQVGYAKINGKWGIAIRSFQQDDSGAEFDETWSFAESPRRLRLASIEYIPALLDELAKEATKNTTDIQEKTNHLLAIVSAVKGEPNK